MINVYSPDILVGFLGRIIYIFAIKLTLWEQITMIEQVAVHFLYWEHVRGAHTKSNLSHSCKILESSLIFKQDRAETKRYLKAPKNILLSRPVAPAKNWNVNWCENFLTYFWEHERIRN